MHTSALLAEALAAPMTAGERRLASAGSRLFATRHYPTLSEALRGGNLAPLLAHMRGVLGSDRVLGKLQLPHPGDRVYFGNDATDTDRSPVYALTRQDPRALAATVRECPVVDPTWRVGPNPFNWEMALVLKYLVDTGAPEAQQRLAVMFLTVHFYASVQYAFFQFYQPNVMAAAVNSLSDKFLLKKEGSMFGTIAAMAWRNHETFLDRLRQGDDRYLFDYFISLRSRMYSMMKGLRSHYERVRASGAYLNQSREFHDDGEVAERSSDSGALSSLVDKLTEAFVGEAADRRLLELAARMADAPLANLSVAVGEIRAREGALIREILQNLLELYFEEQKATRDDIRTRGFLAFAFNVYTRSNTRDGRVERIKAVLDQLLKSHSEAYLRTNREATKSALRKAIFVYCALLAQSRA